MSGLDISVAFDDSSLAAIAQFSHIPENLSAIVGPTIQQIGGLVVAQAQQNTWSAFKNPQGTLAESIGIQDTSTPMEAIVGVGVPYGARLEFGFGPGGSAATDSLGRTYHEQEEPYLEPALEMVSDQAMALIGAALAEAFALQ